MTQLHKGLVLRDPNGAPHPDDFRVDKHFFELFIDDAVGFVAAGADPNAEKIDAAPVKVGKKRGITTDVAEGVASVTGQGTIVRTGEYRVWFDADTINTGDADTVSIEVFVDGAVIATSADSAGGAVRASGVAAAAGAIVHLHSEGRVRLTQGQTVDFRITATGANTPAIKKARFGCEQVGDDDPATLD